VNCEKPDVGRKGIFPTAVLVTRTKDVQVWNLGLREGPRYPLSFVIRTNIMYNYNLEKETFSWNRNFKSVIDTINQFYGIYVNKQLVH
jgi:hypothetical protein